MFRGNEHLERLLCHPHVDTNLKKTFVIDKIIGLTVNIYFNYFNVILLSTRTGVVSC